jgi:hypothetical protein
VKGRRSRGPWIKNGQSMEEGGGGRGGDVDDELKVH